MWTVRIWWSLCAVVAIVVMTSASLTAQPPSVSAWRAQHERQVVDELLQLVSIPNIAGDAANIQRNADLLVTMFTRRGFTEIGRAHV